MATHRLRLAVVAAALPFLLSACSSSTAGGTVTGHLLQVGGPYGAGTPPLSGTVIFNSSSGLVTKVHASASGGFHFDLLVGTYTLTGTSPDLNDGKLICYSNPTTVVVKSATTTTRDVLCSIR
jgi:hypothetical protein